MIFNTIRMNQEFFVKITRWILYSAVGVLVVAVFFVFFGERKMPGRLMGADDMRERGMPSPFSLSDEDRSVRNFESGDVEAPKPMMNEKSSDGYVGGMMMGADERSVLQTAPGSKVVRTGSLSIRVEDAEWSADEIDRIATRLGGFTAARNMNGKEALSSRMPYGKDGASIQDAGGRGNTIENGTVTIKIPSPKLGEALSSIKAIATIVVNESSSASDVTATYADLEAQIRNKRAEEEAFTKILSTTTGKVSDVLEVTRELARVRGEIEQMETQRRYMETQTDMAELSVFLTEDEKVGDRTDTWRPGQTVKDAVNRLLAHAERFVDGTIYFLVSVLPFFFLYLLGLFVLYRIGRMLYRKIRRVE